MRFFNKKLRSSRQYKGFTLAESLIALVIIGVVAAMTISTLIQNSQKREIVGKVFKYHTTLEDVYKKYTSANGCLGNLAACGTFDYGATHATAANNQAIWNNMFKPYLKTLKDCGVAASQGCMAPGVVYKVLNGNNLGATPLDNYNNYPKALLADGASIMVFDLDGNCNSNESSTGTSRFRYSCAHIYIDVNGHNGPNMIGRDVFDYRILNDGVLPTGSLDENAQVVSGEPNCFTNGVSDGHGCAAKIMKDHAMNY